jgi:hypothetical protein
MGFALVNGFTVVWLYEAGAALWGNDPVRTSRQLVTLPDGTVLFERADYSDNAWTHAYERLNGTLVTAPVDRSTIVHGNTLWPSPPEMMSTGPGLRLRVILAATTPTEHWYYVAHRMGVDGLAYLAGYDTQSRRRIGFFGRDGFQTDAPTPEEMLPVNTVRAFGGTLFSMWYTTPGSSLQSGHLHLLTGGRLIQADPRTRSLTPIVDRTDIQDAAPLMTTSWSTAAGVTVQAQPILLRTPHSVIVFDPAAETSREYMLPAECRERLVTFVPIDEQHAAVEAWGTFADGAPQRNDVFVIDRGGELVETHLAAVDRSEWGGAQQGTMLIAAFAVPAPIASILIAACVPLGDAWLPVMWSHVIRETWPAVMVTCVAGLLAALAALRQLRNCHAQHTGLWLTFVFLFGLPGYVGYRLHRRFPRRDPIPPPERLGYEIFA